MRRNEVDEVSDPASSEIEPGPRAVGAATGLVAGAIALGGAELLAAATGPGSSPIVAVGGAAIDLAPEWLKAFAIRTFGERNKLALLIGIGAVLAALAVAIGIASRRRPRRAIGACAVLGAIGAAAAATRPAIGIDAVVPSLVGAGTGILAFIRLREAAGLSPPKRVDRERPEVIPGYDRRRFLRTAGAAAGLAALAGGVGRLVTSRATAADSRARTRLPAPADPAPPLPDGADLDVRGLSPFVTPNDRFYRVDTALFVPAIDAATWRLRIHGMVDREISLDFDQLVSRPVIERDVTLACVSNEVGGPYVGNARWIGVLLADLLREAGVRSGATQIVSRSADGFTIGTPTSVVMDGRDAMLAVGMNGEPLPLEHGFPVRMLVPGLYGYVSATKWLVELELTTLEAYDAYWIQRGWAKEAPVKTQSRIDTPRANARLRSGDVAIAGVAWAQHRGVDRVEARIDDGPWEEARLAVEPSVDTWRQWVHRWRALPGRHTIAVRATDGEGRTQTAERVPPFPDGATGHHTIAVEVV